MSRNRQAEMILDEISNTDYEMGSEDYFVALAEIALEVAGIEGVCVGRRPLLHERIDAALGRSEDLVLCDMDHIDYVCHALSQSDRAERFVLVLPIHNRVERYDFKTGETAETDEIFLRGYTRCSLESWNAYEASVIEFAELLEHCLVGTTDRFLGLLSDESQLQTLAEGFAISQIRATDGAISSHAPLDPISDIQTNDKVWTAVKLLDDNRVNMILWKSSEANGIGYDIGYMRDDNDPYGVLLNVNHLKEIVKLPSEYESQLFVWDNAYDGQVNVSVVDENGVRGTLKVFAAELQRDYNYSPERYLGRSVQVSAVELGSLCKKIQRGTSLKGKDLKIIGDVRDERWIMERPGSFVLLTGGAGPRGIYSMGESYYVDNASIVSNNPGNIVVARILEEIPPGQERYTLLPEDGTVILVPRNGKGEACYFAKGPTLVSNNLFIVWPDSEKVDPEYLVIAMRSSMVSQQMKTKKMPLGKAELSKLLIPMALGVEMQSVVDRSKKIHAEIDELNSRLKDLCNEDPLDLLWGPTTGTDKPE